MRRGIAAVGRTLVTAGLLILLFVAYQLWGTNILEARAQNALERDFERLQEDFAPPETPETTPVTAAPTTTTTVPLAPPLPPAEGEVVGIIEIPKIGLTKFFVQGTSREDLKKGPGHYPATPMPGQQGNAAIAGHRTTYGAPFNRLDELAPGDEISVTYANGAEYVYEVREQVIVSPKDTWVVDNTLTAELTLTTCHPKYSARQRLVVKADLVVQESPPVAEFDPATLPEPVAEIPGDEDLALEDGLQGEHKSLGPAYGWGALAALVGLAWWWLFRRWRHPLTWLVGVGPFLVFLFVFYVFLERALPAGY